LGEVGPKLERDIYGIVFRSGEFASNRRGSNSQLDNRTSKLAQHLVGIVHTCERMHCLPEAGGLFDQDSFFVYGMNIVLAAIRAREVDEEKRRR
jgi:hypothetical protein